MDAEDVYKALADRMNERKKEPTATAPQYKASYEQASKSLSGRSKEALFPFSISGQSALDKVQSQYDDATGKLDVTVEIGAPILGLAIDPTQRAAVVKYLFRPTTTYVEHNLDGDVEIKKTFWSIYELLITNFQDVPRKSAARYRDTNEFAVRIDPTAAHS